MNALWLCGIYALGIGVSILGLVVARHRGSDIGMLFCGWATGTLFLGISIIVMRIISRFTDERQSKRKTLVSKRIDTNIPYIARYPIAEGWIMSSLAAFFGIVTVLLICRYYHLPQILLPIGLCCFCIWYAIRVFVTRIQFTKERITAKRPFLKEISEPYSNIVQVRFGRVSFALKFSSGQSLRINSGLGDAELIIGYMKRFCPISISYVVGKGEIKKADN